MPDNEHQAFVDFMTFQQWKMEQQAIEDARHDAELEELEELEMEEYCLI